MRNLPDRLRGQADFFSEVIIRSYNKGRSRSPTPGESLHLYTSVDADRPRASTVDNPAEVLVEPPGIAPGSGPLITRAFIPIVRLAPSGQNIGLSGAVGKAWALRELQAGARRRSMRSFP